MVRRAETQTDGSQWSCEVGWLFSSCMSLLCLSVCWNVMRNSCGLHYRTRALAVEGGKLNWQLAIRSRTLSEARSSIRMSPDAVIDQSAAARSEHPVVWMLHQPARDTVHGTRYTTRTRHDDSTHMHAIYAPQ